MVTNDLMTSVAICVRYFLSFDWYLKYQTVVVSGILNSSVFELVNTNVFLKQCKLLCKSLRIVTRDLWISFF